MDREGGVLVKRNQSGRRSEAALERRIRAWLRSHGLDRCCLTGRADADYAHVRFHTGANQKPSPGNALPLCRELHTAQENDRQFYAKAGFPDWKACAERLLDCYEKNDPQGVDDMLCDMYERANRAFILPILLEAA